MLRICVGSRANLLYWTLDENVIYFVSDVILSIQNSTKSALALLTVHCVLFIEALWLGIYISCLSLVKCDILDKVSW